jgi:hypothetical protein
LLQEKIVEKASKAWGSIQWTDNSVLPFKNFDVK